MADKKTVVFNVGGTKCEVSRSILETHPNTLLSRSASEQWQHDPNSEVFLDMDGNRFGYCLDYLRHGRVFLPLMVAKKAVLADLEYIGVEEVNEEVFLFEDDGVRGIEAFQAVKVIVDDVDAQIRQHSEMKICLLFAKTCFLKYYQNRKLTVTINANDKCHKKWSEFDSCSEDNKNEAFSKFGIRFKSATKEFFNKPKDDVLVTIAPAKHKS